jgi:hypothetical protein
MRNVFRTLRRPFGAFRSLFSRAVAAQNELGFSVWGKPRPRIQSIPGFLLKSNLWWQRVPVPAATRPASEGRPNRGVHKADRRDASPFQSLPALTPSGSSCVGINSRLQAHLALDKSRSCMNGIKGLRSNQPRSRPANPAQRLTFNPPVVDGLCESVYRRMVSRRALVDLRAGRLVN